MQQVQWKLTTVLPQKRNCTLHREKETQATLLAAREVQRYVYAVSGSLPALFAVAENTAFDFNSLPRAPLSVSEAVIFVGDVSDMVLRTAAAASGLMLPALRTGEFSVESSGDRHFLTVDATAASEHEILYAAYHFAELMGVRFTTYGDVLPPRKANGGGVTVGAGARAARRPVAAVPHPRTPAIPRESGAGRPLLTSTIYPLPCCVPLFS